MMLYCHFQVRPVQQIDFSFPWKQDLRGLSLSINIVEADNHSEPFLIQEITRMISESDRTVCFFHVAENESIGVLAKALEALRKSNSELLMISRGENQNLSKVLGMLKKPHLKFENESQLMRELTEFFKP